MKCLNLVVRRYVGLLHAQAASTADAARQAPAELRKALLGRNRFDLPLLIDAAKDAILTHLDAELLTQAVAALEALYNTHGVAREVARLRARSSRVIRDNYY